MRFVFEQRVDHSREAVFAFHENPANLVRLLDGWAWSRVAAHEGSIREGAVLTIEDRVGPLRLALVFRHDLFEPPHRFGERLVRGPFRTFRHVHEFLADGEATLVRDTVEIALPWYLGGGPATRLVVAPRVRRFFGHRHAALARLLAEDGAP